MNYPLLKMQRAKSDMKIYCRKLFPKNNIQIHLSTSLHEEHQKNTAEWGLKNGQPASEEGRRVFIKDAMEVFEQLQFFEQHKTFDHSKLELLKDSLYAVKMKIEGKSN